MFKVDREFSHCSKRKGFAWTMGKIEEAQVVELEMMPLRPSLREEAERKEKETKPLQKQIGLRIPMPLP